MECQDCIICMNFTFCEPVSCRSKVHHYLCEECEYTWRSKMTEKNGLRIMTCPSCREEETSRTIRSLQREAQRKAQPTLESLLATAVKLVIDTRELVGTLRTPETDFIRRSAERVHEMASSAVARAALPTSAARAAPVPTRSRCASGRCTSTSRTGRAMTYLKCNICNIVFCCRNCKECTDCRP
jgi:hypothetical protein|uniref:Uncharacterized protein n=1 Tax=viral metagenome TaxID=1070528 RepID=A0A6C0AIG7_9ZZZZ